MPKITYLSDAHQFAIAAVATRSSALEHFLEMAVAAAMNGQQKSAEYILKNLGADRIIGLYECLLKDSFPSWEPEIGQLITRIKEVRRERNDVLHWLWGKTENADIAKHGTRRPYRLPQDKTKTAVEIHAIADEMLNLSTELAEWITCHGPQPSCPLAPSPHTLVPPTLHNGLFSALDADHPETAQPPEPRRNSSPS